MQVDYIEWIYPGSFFAETSNELAPGRVRPAVPKNAIGYRFFTRQEVESGDEILRGAAKDYSGWTYFGTMWSAEQIAELDDGKHRILKYNIINNGYRGAVKTKFGSWMPLNENDRVEQA